MGKGREHLEQLCPGQSPREQAGQQHCAASSLS